MSRSFGEAQIFAGFLGGAALCLWLFTLVLPALGFAEFAANFEELADKAAPCLLSPVVVWLISRLRCYGTVPFVLALAGGITFLFSFFVVYDVPKWLSGIALLGAGVGAGYLAYRRADERLSALDPLGRPPK